MAPRGSIVAASFVIALLALACSVDARSAHAGAPPADPPSHAKAYGLTKHAELEETPPAPAPVAQEPPPSLPPAETPAASAPPAEAPPQRAPPVAAATPAPAAVDLPAATITSEQTDINSDSDADATASTDVFSFTGASIVPGPSNEERTDARATTFGAGAATTRAPGWAGEALNAPSSSGEETPTWWIHLAWALPVLGIGGVAAVLVTRQKARNQTLVMAPRAVRMAPVSPDDLQGLLQNGHGAVSRGAYGEAVAWFERALTLQPKLGVALFCKGICLAANGQVADAYGALRTACTVEPEDANYRVHFARVAVTLGKHKEAMDALQIVTRAMPELGPAMLEDPQLAGLRDHPRFLMICGAL